MTRTLRDKHSPPTKIAIDRSGAIAPARVTRSARRTLVVALTPLLRSLGDTREAGLLGERRLTTRAGSVGRLAVPHGKIPGLRRVVAAVVIAPDGVAFDALDGRPVRIFVARRSPSAASGDHVRALVQRS